MAAFAVFPKFFHSPNSVPQAALAITGPDINTGHPTTASSALSWSPREESEENLLRGQFASDPQD
jgi:hypothetical protein